MAKITKRAVEALTSAKGETRLWDGELKGFCVRVYPSGRRMYALKYRTTQGRQRWHTIGQHGSPWTTEQAREEARRMLLAIGLGADPAQERIDRRMDLTVAELIDRYLADGPASKPEKRASTWKIDASNLNRHVRPLLGNRMAKDLRPADCARLVTDVTEGKTKGDVRTGQRGRALIKGGAGTAARTLGTLGAMYAWAKEQGLVEEVPTRGVRTAARPARERFLSPAEAKRLLAVIGTMESEARLSSEHADIFRLLLLTGARRSEIAELRWTEVDLEGGRLTLPPARTKAGGRTGTRRIALAKAASDILAKRKRGGGAYVFPSGRDAEKPAAALQKPWVRVRAEAGLEGLRLHDLRHSFASLALARGASLPLIGKALGHSTSRVTERYAHLADDALSALVDAVAEDLEKKGGEIHDPQTGHRGL